MGFFQGLKEISNWNKKRKQRKEQKANEVNKNPTEEELKNNKKGKLAYLWTFISIVVYVLGFDVVMYAWEENITLGIVALLFALIITPMAHKKAVSLAKDQRKINGKGLMALIIAILLPSIYFGCWFLLLCIWWNLLFYLIATCRMGFRVYTHFHLCDVYFLPHLQYDKRSLYYVRISR